MPPPRALSREVSTRAHLSLLVVVVIWAGSFSVIKALLDDDVSASDIALLRYAIAAPGFAYILWRARGLPGLTRRDAVRVLAAGLLIVVGYHLFLNIGEQHTTSGIAALVVALAPGDDADLGRDSRAGSHSPAARRRACDRVRRRRDRRRLRLRKRAVVRERQRPAHRHRRAARVRPLQRDPEAALSAATTCSLSRRRAASSASSGSFRSPAARRSTRSSTRPPPRRRSSVSRRPRDPARVHPLERRAAGNRPDARGVLHVCDLAARRGDRRDRSRRAVTPWLVLGGVARRRRHRAGATGVSLQRRSGSGRSDGRRAHSHAARAEPGAARASAPARARPSSDPARARATRRHPGSVRAERLHPALVVSRGVSAGRPDACARASVGRPGDADAVDDSRRLAARLLAVRGRDPRAAARLVAPHAQATARGARARTSGREAPRAHGRRAAATGGAGRGRRPQLGDGGAVARPRPRPAVGNVGEAPRAPVSDRRALGRAGGRRSRFGARPPRSPLPRRVRSGIPR